MRTFFLRHRLTPTIAFLFALSLSVHRASADIVYDNFGPGDTYSSISWVIGKHSSSQFQRMAMPFVVSGGLDFTLDSIHIQLGDWNTGPNQYLVSLLSDVNGMPGAVLETMPANNVPSFGNGPATQVLSTINPVLTAGNRYWVSARAVDEALTRGSWYQAEENGRNAFQNESTGPNWQLTTIDVARGAYRVNGTPVPEPTQGLTIIVASLVTAMRSRRVAAGRRCKGGSTATVRRTVNASEA
jgi:hypothetical protein